MPLTDEQVIRTEARKLADRLRAFTDFQHYRKFIDELKAELLNFYAPADKAVYLDEVRLGMETTLAKHRATCRYAEEDCGFEKQIGAILFFISQEKSVLPAIIHENTTATGAERDGVFVSYAHADAKYLERMRRHFAVLKDKISICDNDQIRPGTKWLDAVQAAIGRAKVAILLLSADFFNSDFITKHELPKLPEAAERDGATILTVIVAPCTFDNYPAISQYQAVNDPKRTILQMSEAEAKLTWVELANQLKEIFTRNGLLPASCPLTPTPL